MAQCSNAGRQGPRRPRALAWLTEHRIAAMAVAAPVLAAAAGGIIAAASVTGPGVHATAGVTSDATSPAPEVSVVAADKWLTGPADKLLGALNTDVVNVSKALRGGKRGTVTSAGRQLAAVAEAALNGPMPPADAPLYKSALANLARAGTDAATGQLGAVGPLLAAGTTEITRVTAAADLVAPVNPPAPVNDPNGLPSRVKRAAAILASGLSLLLAIACAGGSTTASGTTDKPRAWWHPTDSGPNNGPEFQWELDHALKVANATDMGSAAMNAAGKKAPDPTVYDIDGIDNPASTVAALHRMHDKVICYIEVGAAGNYYSAASEGVKVSYYAQLAAARDLGKDVPGYQERYLNINAPSTLGIIKAMIRQQCAAKGFDAVEPDIDDSYTDATGFRITEAQDERYDKTLGAYAHSLGLAWGQKNGDQDPAFSKALEPATDFLLDEECNFYRTCSIVAPPYLKARKLVLDAEYADDWGREVAADLRRFCAADKASGIDGTLFTAALSGPRHPCR